MLSRVRRDRSTEHERRESFDPGGDWSTRGEWVVTPPSPDPAQPHSAVGTEERAGLQNAITPLIDIHEGPEGLILEADLPGAAEGMVNIQLEDNVLTLHAKVPSPVPDGRVCSTRNTMSVTSSARSSSVMKWSEAGSQPSCVTACCD